MILISNDKIKNYLNKDDWVKKYLDNVVNNNFICDNWLIESLPKRYIFNLIYKDLLQHDSNMRVYDVGGGLTSFTNKLLNHNDYTLVDILAHGGEIKDLKNNKSNLIKDDWFDVDFKPSEVVIANDLFPNVDQRINFFVEKLIPTTKCIRLTLTWYSAINFYKTNRIEGDEILYMNSWLTEDVKMFLSKFSSRIINYKSSILNSIPDSVFLNNRNVCYIQIKGDL
jgi:hypothetical protein